jgi:hypothetical protein
LVVFDLVRLAFLAAHSRSALAAENLFLRKQPALFQERKVKPRRADDSTRWMMATLSQVFSWRDALLNVKPDTLLRWHRKGFRLFWRWKSKPTGRPRLPKNVRDLIRKMAAENPIWGEERIANELKLKLGIRVSPRTVAKYLNSRGPRREPDPKQRWLTFVRNHAKWIGASDFFVVVTASPPHPLCVCDYGIEHPANPASQRYRSPDGGVDRAAVPGGAARRSSLSIPDSRPGQGLLEGSGQGGGCHGRVRVANASAGAKGKGLRFTLHLLGTVRYDLVHEAALGKLHALRFSRRVVKLPDLPWKVSDPRHS